MSVDDSIAVKQTQGFFSKLGLKPKSKLSHEFLVSGQRFTVDKYYEPHKAVGSGAYGVVCSAIDTRYNCKVAIKKCTNAFDDIIDGKRILREIKILQHFNHENIIGLHDMIPPSDPNNSLARNFKDVYMVLPCMESDLHKIIYSKNALTDEHYQYFIYQILKGLSYMHSCGVIHRDLKPSNLLVNSNCDLKICDFGLSRGMDWNNELTEYVVTRWYRAPEIMCSCNDYNEKIDIWAVGTILAEMIRKRPLFAGEHYINQLNLIFALLGVPQTDSDLACINNKKALVYIKKLPQKKGVRFEDYFRGASPNAIDFLKKTLVFNPNDRLSVTEALEHPYFTELHKKSTQTYKTSPVQSDWEQKCGTREGLKEQMLITINEVRAQAEQKYNQYKQSEKEQ